jgi:hypothetical protein
MAKGQKRSNREVKKPKKAVPEKPKPGASSFTPSPGAANRNRSRKA